jgi:hypothetical protein
MGAAAVFVRTTAASWSGLIVPAISKVVDSAATHRKSRRPQTKCFPQEDFPGKAADPE